MINFAIMFVFSIIILIFSIVIHETAHGWSAYLLGDQTAKFAGRLTLNPLKHLDPIGSLIVPLLTYSVGGFIFGWAKPVPYNPYNLRAGRYGPAIVAAAGPLANLFLVACFSILIRLVSGFASPAFVELSAMVVLVNLILALFNLIPVPPFDGSKILFALSSYRGRFIEEFLLRYQLVVMVLAVMLVWPLIIPFVSLLFRISTGL